MNTTHSLLLNYPIITINTKQPKWMLHSRQTISSLNPSKSKTILVKEYKFRNLQSHSSQRTTVIPQCCNFHRPLIVRIIFWSFKNFRASIHPNWTLFPNKGWKINSHSRPSQRRLARPSAPSRAFSSGSSLIIDNSHENAIRLFFSSARRRQPEKGSVSFRGCFGGVSWGSRGTEKKTPPANCQTSRIRGSSRWRDPTTLAHGETPPASYDSLKKIDLNPGQDNKSALLRTNAGERNEGSNTTLSAIPWIRSHHPRRGGMLAWYECRLAVEILDIGTGQLRVMSFGLMLITTARLWKWFGVLCWRMVISRRWYFYFGMI